MVKITQVDETVALGGQPSQEDLAEIKTRGFRSVINNRPPGEEPGQLDPEYERLEFEAMGLAYRHIPMTGATLTPAVVDRFREALADLPKPVFIHCRSGTRSAGLLMMDKAVNEEISGEEAARRAAELGFDISGLARFIDDYAASRKE